MEIILLYFIIGMFVTMLILYFTGPEPQIIIRYPKITEDISDTYIDNKGVCYKYHKIEIDDK